MLEEVVFRIRYKRIRLFEAIKAFQFPIILGISTRVGYSLWMALIWYMVDGYFPLTEKALHETYYQLSRSTTLLGRSFIDVWLRWDAVHYMNIAELGYQGVGKEETVFFPLYPYTVGFLSHITSINVTLVGILVSSFFTILALICLYDLVLLQFKDENLSKLSTLLFALYPTSFFLHAPFTDAMFMFFTISSILMMEKREYMAAGILGCLAGLTRAQGALLLIPMFVYFIQDYWIDKKPIQWSRIIAMALIPLGTCAYILWRVYCGAPDIITSYKHFSGVIFQGPFTNLIKSALVIPRDPSYSRITEVISAVLFLAILIWMFSRKEFRKHIGIMLYCATTWILIISKSGVSGYGLQCVNRYVIHIFFAFVGLAFLIKDLPVRVKKFTKIGLILFNLINLMLYSFWIFIG